MNRKLFNIATILPALSLFLFLGCTSNDKIVKAIEMKKESMAYGIHSKLIDSLLLEMTLDEKLGQLQQLDGGISKKNLPELIRQGKVGSVLNEVDPAIVSKYQKIALEESRLGIPLLIGRDVIHGYRTIFPIPLAQSASWNRALVKQGAQIAATEASVMGVNWTFAPMIDVTRDPRWGRIAESPGEDAFLTSEMGVAMIQGFQGDGNFSNGNIAACAKHFAAYGMAEGGRDYNSAIVGERQLREVYLRPFESAVEADVMSFMTSFNEVNDVPASGNKFLLKDVLRDEWQYDGLVVSDWESIVEMIPHGFCEDEKDAASKAINAGVDMEMTSTSYNDHIPQLITENKVQIKLIDAAVKRILYMKLRLGLFENPYPVAKNQSTINSTVHREAAKRAAIESTVLLKNENDLLPLSSSVKSIAVIGPLANAPHEQVGTWSFDARETDAITPLGACKELVPSSVEINYAPGLEISRTKSKDGFEKAIEQAKKSDIVLYFVGEEAILSGEAHSRAHLDLPGVQEDLLAELNATGKKIVLVVMAGRPLIMSDIVKQADAVLYAWHGGTMAGPAIIDLILGNENPSGKLPVTFPRAVGQIPIYHAHKNTGRPSSAESWVPIDEIPEKAWQTSLGNKSHYLDEGFTPLYPFGYGLSYSKFSYKNLRTSKSVMEKSGSITVSVEVTNTGKYQGKEVVQLYVQDLYGSVTRPVKELKGFEKILLAAGETQTVEFEITAENLAFFDEAINFTAEAGKFKVWIGGHSATQDFISFEVQ